MNKKTIYPSPVKNDVEKLIELINKYGDTFKESELLQAQEAIKNIKANFVDAGSLIRVSNFAGFYGMKFKDRKISKQAIYQKIDNGILSEIVLDGFKFIDKTMLDNE